jgi:hypothetical protein
MSENSDTDHQLRKVWVVARFEIEKGNEPSARLSWRRKRATSRGSPRSLAAQKRLAQDDNFKLSHYQSLTIRWALFMIDLRGGAVW